MTFSFRFKLMSFTFCIIFIVGGSISLYTIYQGHRRILTTFRSECHGHHRDDCRDGHE